MDVATLEQFAFGRGRHLLDIPGQPAKDFPKTLAVSSCGFALMLAPKNVSQDPLRLKHAQLIAPDENVQAFKINEFARRSARCGLAHLPGEPLVRASASHRREE